MSAASPKIQDKAAEKAHEPSMEEILASIRRIIADDQAVKPAEPAPPARAPALQNDEVLDLADMVEPVVRERAPASKAAPKPAPLDIDALDFDAIDFDAIEPEPAPPPRPAAPEPAAPVPEAEPLISSAAGASVNGAFNLLAHTVSSKNARSLEDLVQDMLKPLLKAWLDDNLPVMVERLVRAEIERVSRGR
ncbi:PopZ family protein [uncultured Methylobacterium sp.]|uniref:PopZ family protein n=1 Tax=uncultured Methylobacterium sp. TaxID=157278 RepID=UPI0035CA5C4E